MFKNLLHKWRRRNGRSSHSASEDLENVDRLIVDHTTRRKYRIVPIPTHIVEMLRMLDRLREWIRLEAVMTYVQDHCDGTTAHACGIVAAWGSQQATPVVEHYDRIMMELTLDYDESAFTYALLDNRRNDSDYWLKRFDNDNDTDKERIAVQVSESVGQLERLLQLDNISGDDDLESLLLRFDLLRFCNSFELVTGIPYKDVSCMVNSHTE